MERRPGGSPAGKAQRGPTAAECKLSLNSGTGPAPPEPRREEHAKGCLTFAGRGRSSWHLLSDTVHRISNDAAATKYACTPVVLASFE